MPVPLVGPDGRNYVIEDPANVQKAIDLGYRPVTTEAPKTFGEQARGAVSEAGDTLGAAGTGALSGLTAGLSGVGLGEIKRKFETPEETADRTALIASQQANVEAHPLAHGVGEFAGMLASPVNAVAKPLEGAIAATSALGRIGASVAGQSAVGALQGAGNALSDSALGDHQLTAEKLIAGAGLGALLGGAGGLMGGAIDEAASLVLPKLGKAIEGAQDSLKEFADKRWLKAGGGIQHDIGKIPEWRRPMVADAFRGHVPLSGDLKGTNEALKASRDTAGAKIGEFIEKADLKGAQPVIDPSQYLKDLNPLEAPAIAKDIKELTTAMQKNEGVVLVDGVPVRTGEPGGGFKGAHDVIHALGERANWKNAAIGDPDPVHNRLLKDLYREVKGDFDAQLAQHLGSDASKAFLDANAKYGALTDALTLTGHGLKREFNRSISASDYLTGIGLGVMHGGPMGALSGLAGAIGHKVLRERGASVVARLADGIAKSPALSTIAASFGQRLAQAAPQLGQYAAPLLQAFEHSPAQGLAAHMALAKADPGYAEVAAAAGFAPESADQHHATLTKAHGIASIAGVLAEHDKALDKHIEQVFRGTRAPHSAAKVLGTQDFGSKRQRKDEAEAHDKRVEEIRQLSADPNALLDRITGNVGNLANIAPSVTAAMSNTANQAVQYLTKAAEQPPKGGPLAPDWVPSAEERHDFAQKLEAVQDPMSVLKHAAAGTLTSNQVDAFQAVYPTLARQVADKTLMRLVDNPKGVPYRARLMLGLLTGTDPDGTLAGTAGNQTAIAAASTKPSNEGMGEGATNEGKLTVAQRTATPQQRRELQTNEA